MVLICVHTILDQTRDELARKHEAAENKMPDKFWKRKENKSSCPCLPVQI